MGVVLRVTDDEILIFSFDVSVNFYQNLWVGSPFILKIHNFTVKPLQIDKMLNGEIFSNFEFVYSKSQPIVSRSLKKISG